MFAVRYLREIKKCDVADDLMRFIVSMNRRPSSSNYRAATLNFLESSGVDISSREKREIRRKTRKQRSIVEMDDPLTREQINALLHHSDLLLRTIILMLASSGMRIGELLQLQWDNIPDMEAVPTRVNIGEEITKTRQARVSFFSLEAMKSLHEWQRLYPAYLTKRDKIIGFGRAREAKERIFPITYDRIQKKWITAAKKAGIHKVNSKGRSIYHIHSLRAFFRCQGAKVNTDIAEAIMGHQGYLSNAYRRYSISDLTEFYNEAEPYLSVTGTIVMKDPEAQKEIANLQSQIELVNAVLEALIETDPETRKKVGYVVEQIKAIGSQSGGDYFHSDKPMRERSESA